MYDGATNRVRVGALDVEVVHRLRNVLRALQFADSVHVAPMDDLVRLARRPLLAYVVVQVLVDVENEVLVGTGQPGHEHLPCHVASLVGVLANPDMMPTRRRRSCTWSMRAGFTRSSTIPPGVRAPVPAEQPGQQATLEFFVRCQNLVGQALEVVSRADHRQEERSHDLAIAHHAHRLVRHTLMDGEIGAEHALERCRQLMLVLEFMRAKREVNTVGRLRAVRSRSLRDVAFGDVPAEDETEVVGLLDISVHRHELHVVALLVSVLAVGVHLVDESVDFFVFAGADVVHHVVHAPLASFQRRCGHDEVLLGECPLQPAIRNRGTGRHRHRL